MSGNTVVEKKDAARAILRALGRNEAVGVLIDQNAGLDEGVFVDFFGIPACVGTAFARIANRTRGGGHSPASRYGRRRSAVTSCGSSRASR